MDATSCYCYFVIKGNFDPNEVSKKLGVKPTKQWAVGDKRKNGGTYNFALWETGFSKIEYPNIEIHTKNAIRELQGKEDLLAEIKSMHDVSFTLEIVPSIYNGKEPIIEFGHEVIKFCYLTNTDIDIDMYVYPFEDKGTVLSS